MIVADSGPIIAFARIGRLDILQRVFHEVAVPEAVYMEVAIVGRGRAGSSELDHSPWFRRQNITEPLAAPDLHPGEREAIALALALHVPVLLDERRGRRIAQREGVQVLGTLWVLAAAKRERIVPEVRPILEALRAFGYWIGPEVVTAFLRHMQE